MLFTLENNKLSTSFDMVSALEALLAEEKKLGITTNCRRFDQLFGEGDHGGIPLGALTEICGMAGLGKVTTMLTHSVTFTLYLFTVSLSIQDSNMHAVVLICSDPNHERTLDLHRFARLLWKSCIYHL